MLHGSRGKQHDLFVWRIVPRIRTGLKPFDHQIGHHRGWTPSYRCTQTSLRLHNLPLSAVEEIPGTGGKTDKTRTRTFENLSNFSTGQVRGENEKKSWRQQPEMPETNWVASWWTQEAACLRQRHGMPGFWSCELLRVVLLRNVGENSSMLG